MTFSLFDLTTKRPLHQSDSDHIKPPTNEESMDEIGTESCDSEEDLKEVSFCEKVIIFKTLHHCNYTKAERKQCWYATPELMKINRLKEVTINLFHDGILESDTDEFSLRGLEHRTIYTGKKRRVKTARMVVLETQRYQRFNHPDNIMTCYKAASESCRLQAYVNGAMDEIEIFGLKSNSREKASTRISTRKSKSKTKKITGANTIKNFHNVSSILHVNRHSCFQKLDNAMIRV
mmetsp:Transcript_12047/g.18481  ORF Transcript_12047/g.18481 Transcript_12047/m.18481 type:complete len:234 (-) Transcript_12047:116-817(-)